MSSKTKQYIFVGLVLAVVVGGFFWSRALSGGPDVISKNGIHWHSELSIFINGEKQSIPANVGIPPGTTGHPGVMHTHDTDNLIHIEFQGIVRNKQTRIGDFFQIWGKDFGSGTLLGNKAENGKTIKMFVNGKENTEFENYQLKDKDRIEIRYE